MEDGTLILELVHDCTDVASTRLTIHRTVCRALRGTLASHGVLRMWQHVRRARRAWSSWRLYVQRATRPRVNSWVRHRLHTDETPVLPFGVIA